MNKEAISPQTFIELFHNHYYVSGVHLHTHWLGVEAVKCPLDLWIYQEILFDIKPSLIIETGTRAGGSAYYLASMCDLLNHGRVITIDIDAWENRPVHPRITYLTGSSTSLEILEQVESLMEPNDKVMIILDSDHHKDHVLSELQVYSRLVTPGSYLIVEDTNINGNPVYPSFGPGPMEAVTEFLAKNKNFASDPGREKFFLTFNPKGFLARIA